MKLQYCSDLHLEMSANRAFLQRHPLPVKGDILILAGDIVPFVVIDDHKDFFDYLADNFAHTYWLPGNHEYYGADIAERSGVLHEKIRSNVSLVNNIAIDHAPVRLIFSTLWSYISPAQQWEIQRRLSDFHTIRYNGQKLTPAIYNQLHADCLSFLEQEIHKSSDPTKVVITHHVPTFMHYPDAYKNDNINQAFATELYDLIHPSDIHLWLYGHHHSNIPDFKIGNTTMATNQLGYVKQKVRNSFDWGRVVMVS